jgi:hypothetical protein
MKIIIVTVKLMQPVNWGYYQMPDIGCVNGTR